MIQKGFFVSNIKKEREKNPAYGRHRISWLMGIVALKGGGITVGKEGLPMKGLKLIMWSEGQWEA